jgi:fibro-slime domain-containing protein/choice-of-anchor A domain-containing protein
MNRVIIALFLFATLAFSQGVLTLQAIVRDFTPSHPDFEHYLGDGRGAVLNTLDSDGKPQLNPDPATWGGVFTGPSYFAEWYRDTPGVSFVPSFLIQLNLTETAPGSGVYEYNNQTYFPIDNEGFGNYLNFGHNFHFTTEIRTRFTYLAGQQTFSFCGDDDLYVFVNGYKIMDLGGVHATECSSVNLDDVAAAAGIVNGSTYDMAIFNAERHTVSSDMKIDTSIVLTPKPIVTPNPGRTTYFCGIKFDNYGAGYIGVVPNEPTFTAFGTYGFDNFNAISFDSFYVPTGDIQGRLAVRNSFKSTNGYSVGLEINSGGASATDIVLPYSFVVGGNAEFDIGSIFPDGSNQAHFSPAEYAFVGGTFTAPPYLQSRRTGGPAPGLLNPDFDNALLYYELLSTELAAVTPNTAWAIQYGGLTITCNDNSGAYYVSIDAASFTSANYYNAPIGCNLKGFFVITVTGGDTTFGQSMQTFVQPEYMLYNFPGKGRTITANNQPMGSILAPDSTLYQPSGTIVGNVVVGNVSHSLQINRLHCPAHPPPIIPSPVDILCPTFESNCEGLVLPVGQQVASFRDFNFVSFGNFVDFAGDIQGRLAVAGNCNVSSFSVGYELHTLNGPDANIPYSLVVGGNLYFGTGSIYPDGSNVPYPGSAEGIYVGGNAYVPDYIRTRITGGPGSLASWFGAARTCYNQFSQSFSSVPDNVIQSIQYGGLLLHCQSNLAAAYYVTVPATTFNTITYYILDNCNFQASWVVNIAGAEDVVFYGGSFPAVGGGLVYNVLGTGRTITVSGTGVTGHILAPWNILNQTNSVIDGKVVVGDVINCNQVNKPICTANPPVTLTSALAQGASAGATSLNLASSVFVAGDVLSPIGATVTGTSNNGKTVTLASGLGSSLPQGSFITTVVNDTTSSRITPTKTTSGASASGIFVALLVALIALTM